MIRFILILSGLLALSFPLAQSAMAQTPQDDLPPPLSGEPAPDASASLENPFEFDGPMTPDRLEFLVRQVDEDASKAGNGFVFNVEERQLRIVYDERADRMRIITPIIPLRDLPEGLLLRLLQANFDAVLDSRYAIGSGAVWSIFVHRLSSLTAEDLLSGIAQTAVAAETFGTSFSSGAFVFGGGDSNGLNERLLERLREAIEKAEEEDRGI